MNDTKDWKLASRRAIVQRLLCAKEAAESKPVVVLVSGPAGVGKTVVVEQALAEHAGGLYGLGRTESVGKGFFSAVVQALASAVTPWLQRASESEIEQLRSHLVGFEDVVSNLIPSLGAALGRASDSENLLAEHRNRIYYALRALVIAVSQLSPPCVLVLDGFQSLDDETLRSLEWSLSDPELGGVLAVLCCRSTGAGLERALEALKLLEAAGVQVHHFEMLPLSLREVTQIVGGLSWVDASQVASISAQLFSQSGGSPRYLHHAIELMSKSGLDEPEGWMGSDPLVGLLRHHLEAFGPDEREILGLVACAEQPLNLAVLNRLLLKHFRQVNLEQLVARCVRLGLLLNISGVQPAVQLSNDCLQALCAGSPTCWPARNLMIVESALEEFRDLSKLADESLFWLCDRALVASSLLGHHPDRLKVLELAVLTSRRARALAFSEACRRSAELAQRLLIWSDPSHLSVAVHIEHAISAWLGGDVEHFEALAVEAEKIATPLELIPVMELRLQAAIAKGEMTRSLDLALKESRRLFPTLPEPMVNAIISTDLDEIRRMLLRLKALGPARDPRVIGVGRLLNTVNAAAYVGAPNRLSGLVALELELSLEYGYGQSFPLALAFWAAILATRLKTLEVAIEIARFALSRLDDQVDGLVKARTRDLVYGMVLCWDGDLRSAIEPLQANHELSLKYGTFEYAGYSLLKSLNYRLFCGESLAELSRELKAGAVKMRVLGQTRIASYLDRDCAVVRQLLDPGVNPSILVDLQFDGQALGQELEQAGDRYGLLYLAVSRLLLAVVFEQYEDGVELADQAEQTRDGGPGLAHQAMLSWLSGLARMAGPSQVGQASIEAAEHLLEHVLGVALFAPVPWSSRAWLLRAEIARQRGDRARALTAYEEALLQAQRHALTLDEVLICQGRALMEDQVPWVWRNRSQTALRRWRALPATVSFSGQEVTRMLEACLQVTSAESVSALGCALLDLLWLTLGGDSVVVVNSDIVPFASWNAAEGLGRESIETVFGLGSPQQTECSICVAITLEGRAVGAIYVEVTSDSQGRAQEQLVQLQRVADLAGLAWKSMSQKNLLGKAKLELCDRESLYSTLVAESSAGIFVRDRSGRILLANQAFADVLGQPLHQVLGRQFSYLVDVAVATEHQQQAELVLRTERPVERFERFCGLNGQQRSFLVSRLPYKDRWGKLVGVCGICTDVTELQYAQQEIEKGRVAAALGSCASKIAHDFNNVLNGLLGNVEMLLEDAAPQSKMLEGLRYLEAGCHQGVSIVEQILEFGRVKGKDFENLKLDSLVESEIGFLSGGVAAGVDLNFTLRTRGNWVRGNSVEIRRVLANLVRNAVQALPASGGLVSVQLGTDSSEEWVCLSVEDNGCGMSESTVASVLTPFFTTKASGQGTGLGLCIADEIMRAHQGRLEIWSELGVGSRFSLYFPCAAELV
jgi:PAS domain S-box-containing protein